MTAQQMFWAIVILGFTALITLQVPGAGRRIADFNFSTGLVDDPCKGLVMADCGKIKCGVAGMSNTCGSVKE